MRVCLLFACWNSCLSECNFSWRLQKLQRATIKTGRNNVHTATQRLTVHESTAQCSCLSDWDLMVVLNLACMWSALKRCGRGHSSEHEIQRLTDKILFSTEWGDTAFGEAKLFFPKGKWEGEENNNQLWQDAVNMCACKSLRVTLCEWFCILNDAVFAEI